MAIDILFWLLATLAGVGVVALLAWTSIRDWLYTNKLNYDDYGDLVRKSIGEGKVRVVAGVFNRHGTRTALNSWEAESVDSELQQKFGRNDQIRISL